MANGQIIQDEREITTCRCQRQTVNCQWQQQSVNKIKETILQPRLRSRKEGKRMLSSAEAGPLSMLTVDTRSSPVELQCVTTVRESYSVVAVKGKFVIRDNREIGTLCVIGIESVRPVVSGGECWKSHLQCAQTISSLSPQTSSPERATFSRKRNLNKFKPALQKLRAT